MKLFCREYGDGPPVVLLHGLLGSSENWHTIAQRLSSRYRVVVPDLRNHGRSPHSDEFDYHLLAADLKELVDEKDLQKPLLVGHSLGGKTAMEFSFTYPDIPRAVVVEDMIPGSTEPISGGYLGMLRELDLGSIEYRREAEEQLLDKTGDRTLVRFLLKNLQRSGDGSFSWKANLKALNAHYNNVWQSLKADRMWEGPALFIRGDRSSVVADGSFEEIFSFFPGAKIVTIEGAGHWVHGEKADEFTSQLLTFFADVETL